MKDMIKVTLSLVVIFIAAGLIMGLTYMKTSPVRFIAEKKEHEEALKLMAPEATDPIHAAGKWSVHHKEREYYAATAGGKTVAYIADTAGKGYSSFIQMLVSLDTDLKIKDVNILHHGETPGLGDQVEDRKLFLDQFKGKGLSQLVLIKGETTENIQAITGATISSRAVTNGVKDAVQMLVDKYGAGVQSAAGQGATHEVKHEHK
ncbi:MAG: RnfABCDGE type electron transport complex subunit G [Nitrospirota bacterium]